VSFCFGKTLARLLFVMLAEHNILEPAIGLPSSTVASRCFFLVLFLYGWVLVVFYPRNGGTLSFVSNNKKKKTTKQTVASRVT
jgi:hypothetical protein